MAEIIDLQTERRIVAADEAGDATKWTPRDVLVDILRQIDAGEISPDTLAVVWLEPIGDTGVVDRFTMSIGGDTSTARYKAVFLAEAFKRSLFDNA